MAGKSWTESRQSGQWGRRKVVGAGVLVALTAVLFMPLMARASAPDDDLTGAAARLDELADFLDGLSDADGLADNLPLSGLTPKDALDLADVFDDEGNDAADSLKEKLAGLGDVTDVESFETALDGLDTTGPGGVGISVGGPESDGDDGRPVVRKNADGTVDIAISFAVTKEVDVPIEFATSLVDLTAAGSDGTFPVLFTFESNDLQLVYDRPADLDPSTAATALSIKRQPALDLIPGGTAPTLTMSAKTAPGGAELAAFATNLGFTAIDVTGSLSFDVGVGFEILDPDASGGGPGDGKISILELTSTALDDLVDVSVNDDPATNAVEATIEIASDLLDSDDPGTDPTDDVDVTISYVDASLIDATDGATTLDPATPSIGDFRNFTAADALGGIMRLISMLDSLQATGKLDVNLPFVSGGENVVDPSAAAHGTFSDALRVADRLYRAVIDPPGDADATPEIAEPSSDPANPNAIGAPTFSDAEDLAAKLAAALGLPADSIAVAYDTVAKRLEYSLDLADDATATSTLNFGDVDLLSAIRLDTDGSISLDAGYDLDLDFAFDLSTQPVEGAGSPIGSCTDGVDNDNDGLTDAFDQNGVEQDTDCAGTETLEQRVSFEVGTDPNAAPELVANLGVVATEVDASARVGLLEAGISDAYLVIGSADGEDGPGGLGPESCSDNIDQGEPGTDMADPACRAQISINFTDTDDGWMTVRELLNALGAGAAPNVEIATNLTAGVKSVLPVAADLLPDVNPGGELGGGDIVVTGSFDGPITDAGAFIDSLDIDASDVETTDIFNFSPCSNDRDDDGDGVVNDGCGDLPAVDESEDSSTALFAQIIEVIRQVSAQLEASGVIPAGVLDEPLPLVGTSFNDLVSIVDSLTGSADSTENADELSLGAAACTNNLDDDADGVVNDGCPVTSGGADTQNLPESACADAVDDDGDGVINDGCQPAVPSVQTVADALAASLERVLLASAPGVTADVTGVVGYDADEENLTFTLTVDFGYEKTTSLTLGALPGILGTLIAIEPLDATLSVDADLTVGFGVNLGDLEPFVLGNTAFGLDASVAVEEISFGAGVGSLTIGVGQDTPTPEDAADCADTEDSDGDGFVNDGCAPVSNPETGGDCTGSQAGKDDDGDGIADDGCAGTTPAQVGADPESGGDCTDADKRGKDNDGDGVADDGCNQANLPAASPGGDQANDKETGAQCGLTNAADDDDDGVVNDGCPAKADKGRFFLGAGADLYVGDEGPADDDVAYSLGDVTFGGGFGGTDQAGCAGLAIPDDGFDVNGPVAADDEKFGCAVLPLFFGDDTPIGSGASPTSHHVLIAITDFDPSTYAFHYDTSELDSILSSQLIDLLLMNSGLDRLLDVLEGVLESDLLSFALPLIGGQTATAASIVDDLRESIKAAVEDAVSGGNPLESGGPTAGDVKTIVDNLASTIDAAIDGVDALEGGTFSATIRCREDEACDLANDPAIDVSDVAFRFAIAGDVDLFDPGDPLSFDIGIPGLGLTGDLAPRGTISYSFDFGFGVSRNEGFYFLTDAAGKELNLTAEVLLSDPSGDPGVLTGTLGFLEIKAVDGDPAIECASNTPDDVPCRRNSDDVSARSHVTASFSVDLVDPGNDGRLTISEISQAPSFGDLIEFDLQIDAAVNLHLETGFPGGAGLPKIVGDLHITWNWHPIGQDSPLPASSAQGLSISLDAVGLDVGTYVSKFLRPVLADVKRFTDPLKPIIDTVTACIPVLSDLSGSCQSLLTLAETLNSGTGFVPDFVFDVVRLVQFVQSISSISNVPGNLTIPIGDGTFQLVGETLKKGKLDSTKARDAYAAGELDQANSSSLLTAMNDQDFVKDAGSSDLKASDLSKPSTEGGIGLTLPFLEQPSKLHGPALRPGRRPRPVGAAAAAASSFSYSQKFGPIWAVPPVFLEIGGSVSASPARSASATTPRVSATSLFNKEGPSGLLRGPLPRSTGIPLEGGPDSTSSSSRASCSPTPR